MSDFSILSTDEITPAGSNRWGLVYENPLESNEPGAIQLTPITYMKYGIEIRANLYAPADYPAQALNDEHELDKTWPAVVVSHPNGGVKEQVSGLFAQHLADQGYIALAFDAAYQGASGGWPRLTDTPHNRISDISRAADILAGVPGVDKNRLGLLGICGGGGYALGAAQVDHRFAAVATVSMFNTGLVRRNGLLNSGISGQEELLGSAQRARATDAAVQDGSQATPEAELSPNITNLTPEQANQLPLALYRDGYYYYGHTHSHPNSDGRYTLASLTELIAWDATDRMDMITAPLPMIAGSVADTRYMTEAAFPLATRATSRELRIIGGASHIETYWKHPYVDQEFEALDSFYSEHLGPK